MSCDVVKTRSMTGALSSVHAVEELAHCIYPSPGRGCRSAGELGRRLRRAGCAQASVSCSDTRAMVTSERCQIKLATQESAQATV
jgi:hypothetical protein